MAPNMYRQNCFRPKNILGTGLGWLSSKIPYITCQTKLTNSILNPYPYQACIKKKVKILILIQKNLKFGF